MAHPVAFDATHHNQEVENKTLFGFWVYIMTDCVLFATLFATYAVLCNNTFGGSPGRELFSMREVLTETLILLTSSFTCGLIMLAAHAKQKAKVLFWIAVTMILGFSFLGIELREFYHLCQEGNSWRRSGFLTSFFTLVGTHGAHITFGLLWAAILGWQVFTRGITHNTLRRLGCFSLFWHFLDIVWIFIFTIVYLMGAI